MYRRHRNASSGSGWRSEVVVVDVGVVEGGDTCDVAVDVEVHGGCSSAEPIRFGPTTDRTSSLSRFASDRRPAAIIDVRDRALPSCLARDDRRGRAVRDVRDRGPRRPGAGLRRGAAHDAIGVGAGGPRTATRPTSSTRTSATRSPRSAPCRGRSPTHLHEACGVERGDRVAIAMRNYPEWVVAYWATVSLGAAVVGMNAWWTSPEMEYGLADSRPKVLIADDERLERAIPILSGLRATAPLHVIAVRSDRVVPDDPSSIAARVVRRRARRWRPGDLAARRHRPRRRRLHLLHVGHHRASRRAPS